MFSEKACNKCGKAKDPIVIQPGQMTLGTYLVATNLGVQFRNNWLKANGQGVDLWDFLNQTRWGVTPFNFRETPEGREFWVEKMNRFNARNEV